ncbi:MAG TPA: dUTP diphosphatase [Waddliaceae bacterium]
MIHIPSDNPDAGFEKGQSLHGEVHDSIICDEFSWHPYAVKVKKLSNYFALPQYAKEGDAGADLYAAEDFILKPFEKVLVSTGIAIQLPKNTEAQIRSRSGLASRGIIVVNSPGTIDSSFSGEIKVILGYIPFVTPMEPDAPLVLKFQKGDRIAQMVIAPFISAKWIVVEELDTTSRGAAGFGSTGI